MKKLLLLFLSLLVLGIKAQNGFMTYTTNITLPGTLKINRALLVDYQGNKWFGYQVPGLGNGLGLLKYEENTGSWKIYNKASVPRFPSHYVTDIKQDALGNLWIGCDTGLVKFDGVNFITYNVNQGLPINMVRKVEIVGNQVYAVTYKGLSRFDGVGFINYNEVNGNLPFDSITAISIENPNTIWLGGREKFARFNIDNSLMTTSYSLYTCPANSGVINCIYTDLQNLKWIGTTNNGVLMFDNVAFKNVMNEYDIIGVVPKAIYDICRGINGGVVFKLTYYSSTNLTSNSDLVELTPEKKVYYYLAPTSALAGTFNILESDGIKIYYILNNLYQSPKVFGVFDDSNYSFPFGEMSSNNFKFLDINQIKAGIGNNSSMHWDTYNSPHYEVPKNSGKHTTNGSSLWISGLDNNNLLHGGAQYCGQYYDKAFWPGPLDTISLIIDSTTCKQYDKVWKVNYSEINDFITNFNNGNIQNGTYVIPEDILTWPAHGAGNNSRSLAPFIDYNGDGNYNPLDGDYPKIKGDQALYFIYNDKLSVQSYSFSPMGLEIHCMAYAYGCDNVVFGRNELKYTTFYEYKIINRSNNNYHDVYVGLWSDAKIGRGNDDMIGCDVNGNFGYVFNGDSLDEGNQDEIGYGYYPPAQGTLILKGPKANNSDGIDNDNNGVIDEFEEECKLTKFISIYEGSPSVPIATQNPINNKEFYNFLQGRWRDSTSLTCGMDGYGGNINTNWMYPGDPNGTVSSDPNNTCGNWIYNAYPYYFNYITSSGPFNLNAGQTQEVEYAFVTSFDSSSVNNSNLLSVAKLKTDMQKVKAFYELQNKPSCLQTSTKVKEIVKQTEVVIYPNPSKSIVNVVANVNDNSKINYELVDVLGKQVMQNEVSSSQFSINVSDLKAGVYFLRLQVNESIVVKKIVKE